jgi:hypothetical protein
LRAAKSRWNIPPPPAGRDVLYERDGPSRKDPLHIHTESNPKRKKKIMFRHTRSVAGDAARDIRGVLGNIPDAMESPPNLAGGRCK